jgi:hypothetical protein
MRYYYSDLAQSPFFEVPTKDDLKNYPDKMHWQSEDGVVLVCIIETHLS